MNLNRLYEALAGSQSNLFNNLSPEQKSIKLFLFGCIPFRLFLVWLVYKYSHTEQIKYLGWIGLIIAISFIYIYITGSRKTGPEVFGKPIWWNYWRPIHAIFWFGFAYNILSSSNILKSNAWVWLLGDVLFGFKIFVKHHWL